MKELFELFSTREISIAIWFIFIFGGLLILSNSFKSFGLVVKAIFAKQLFKNGQLVLITVNHHKNCNC